ncbi:hypothetical protein NM688_g7238 [Phlebia brevispora]|uniref:Uncharacterized protein n=1 Tax=Phlebia brevispora TaxID=194682 RepID=A0ACC1S7P5_9APHY|nr:hypothetical protein NM688_g7238 [Phlebia brevispora]
MSSAAELLSDVDLALRLSGYGDGFDGLRDVFYRALSRQYQSGCIQMPHANASSTSSTGRKFFLCDCTMRCKYLKEIAERTFYAHRALQGNTWTDASSAYEEDPSVLGNKRKLKMSTKRRGPNKGGRRVSFAPYPTRQPQGTHNMQKAAAYTRPHAEFEGSSNSRAPDTPHVSSSRASRDASPGRDTSNGRQAHAGTRGPSDFSAEMYGPGSPFNG